MNQNMHTTFKSTYIGKNWSEISDVSPNINDYIVLLFLQSASGFIISDCTF